MPSSSRHYDAFDGIMDATVSRCDNIAHDARFFGNDAAALDANRNQDETERCSAKHSSVWLQGLQESRWRCSSRKDLSRDCSRRGLVDNSRTVRLSRRMRLRPQRVGRRHDAHQQCARSRGDSSSIGTTIVVNNRQSKVKATMTVSSQNGSWIRHPLVLAMLAFVVWMCHAEIGGPSFAAAFGVPLQTRGISHTTSTTGTTGTSSSNCAKGKENDKWCAFAVCGKIGRGDDQMEEDGSDDEDDDYGEHDEFAQVFEVAAGVPMADLNWRVEKLRLEEQNTKRFLKARPAFLPYNECCKWVQAFGRWKTEDDWREWIAMGEKRNSYIPSRPDEYYQRLGAWKSWDHFLLGTQTDGDVVDSDDFA